RSETYSALATLKIGPDILKTRDNMRVAFVLALSGCVGTDTVGPPIMSDPVSAAHSGPETAGAAGPRGMATLAAYAVKKDDVQSSVDYLNTEVFASQKAQPLRPEETGVLSFNQHMERYKEMLHVERAAVAHLN